MSNLQPNVIKLDRGLDLQTPTLFAEAGTLSDVLNYEHVDYVGLKRIDGIERYDGYSASEFTEVLQCTVPDGTVAGNIVDLSQVDPATGLNVVVGRLLGTATMVSAAGSTQYTLLLKYKPFGSGPFQIWGNADPISTISPETIDTSALTPEEKYNWLLEVQSKIRGSISEPPANVAALHWHYDKLYAVASLPYVDVATSSSTYVEYYKYLPLGTADTILTAFFESITGGVRIYYLGSSKTPEVGDALLDGTITAVGAASNYAGLWSVTPDNAGDLGSTWKAHSLGFKATYSEGKSNTGSWLTRAQYLGDNLAGGTSDTGGTGGTAGTIEQGRSWTGMPNGRGWKTVGEPALYDVDPAVLQYVDDTGMYADAYISWADGEVTLGPTTEKNVGNQIEFYTD